MDRLANGQPAPTHRRASEPAAYVVAAGLACFAALALLPPAALLWAWLAKALSGEWQVLAWAVPSARAASLLGNSLALALAVSGVATVFGAALALWLYQAGGRFARLARRLYLLPLLIPPYLQALAWMAIAGRRQLLDQLLSLLAGGDRVTASGYGFLPAVLVLALAFAPIVTLLTLAGLEAVEPELVEQASLLRPGWPVAYRIVFPLVAPATLAGAGLVFVLALVEYGVPSVLQFNVYSMEIYASFSQDNDPLHALAVALVLLLPALAVLAGGQWLMKSNPLRGQPRRRLPLAMAEWPAWARSLPTLGLCAAALGIAAPVAILAWRSGSLASFAAAVSGGGRELALTIAVALVAATLAAPLSVLAGIAIARAGRLAAAGWLLCALPLAIPAPLTGIAWIYLGSQPSLDWAYGTPAPLVLVHLSRLLPFAVFAAAAQVRRIDPMLFEAAALHDVAPWRRLWRVQAPLLAPALLLSWLVVFVLSLGELGASLMVAPPGQATLPMRVYNLMHYGATDTVAALALVLLVCAALASGAVLAVGRLVWPWTT